MFNHFRHAGFIGMGLAFWANVSLVGAQTYVTKQIVDPESQAVAITYKAPQGWTSTDRVYWNRKIRINPMSIALTVGNPDQEMLVSYISALSFDFLSNGQEVLAGKVPPETPSDYLLFDFNSVHPNAQYQIISREDDPIPFPYKPAVANVRTRACRSKLKVRFANNGVDSVEDLSMDFYGYSQPAGLGRTRGNWIVDGLTVMVAPTDEQGSFAEMRQNILGTAKMTPAFLRKYQNVCADLLSRTKAETRAMKNRRRRVVVVHGGGGGGYYGGRAFDKDAFILHENLRSLRTRIFNYAIGN